MNPDVDKYINSLTKWVEELELLRKIIAESDLFEEFKWGVPVYTYKNCNIVGINGFKDCCAVGFFKGQLLSDPHKILHKSGKNSQAGSNLKFESVNQILELKPLLLTYIYEAIEIEKMGLKVEYKKPDEMELCEEFKLELKNDHQFKKAFEALTPGRQKAYILFFSEPKQSQTRKTRIEKYKSRIFIGKGLNDCICGLSHKMPGCDGTHKYQINNLD